MTTRKEQAVIVAAIVLREYRRDEAPTDMLERAMQRLMDAVADLQDATDIVDDDEEVYLIQTEEPLPWEDE